DAASHPVQDYEIRQAGDEMGVDERRARKRDKYGNADEQHRDEQKRYDDHRRTRPLVRRYLMRDVVRTTPADPRVSPDILRLTDKHQETSEGDAGVDITHRQIEHRHALEVHALGDRPRHECEQAKKSELDEIDEGQQRRTYRSGLHDVRKQLDGDVRI